MSIIVISLASFATAVPSPIESPTWAAFRAGASLVPSPVTATTWLLRCRALTRRSLSIGLARAIILRSLTLLLSSPSDSSPRFGPVMMFASLSPCFHNPIWRPISRAVPGVSPVTIFTLMPASIQCLIASGTSSRTGSEMAQIPKNSRLFATRPSFSIADSPGDSSLQAKPRVRIALPCQSASLAWMASRSRFWASRLQRLKTISGAPFRYTKRLSSGNLAWIAIYLRWVENGISASTLACARASSKS